MNDIPMNPNNMVETSDSLEAVGVFRTWKNIFFVLVLICLLLTQAVFWAADLELVAAPGAPGTQAPPAVTEVETPPADEPPADEGFLGGVLSDVDFDLLARVLGVANGVLIISGILYALSTLFSLMISLVGRLGGMSHIARAFILSLIMAALIIPWQRLFGSNIVGVVYGTDELVRWLGAKSEGMPNIVFYYLRFTGLWLVVLLLLVLAQHRSARWSKSILRRLEII